MSSTTKTESESGGNPSKWSEKCILKNFTIRVKRDWGS